MAYKPRLKDDTPKKSNKYYNSANPYEKSGYGMWKYRNRYNRYGQIVGGGYGNCVAYAWGRFHEILGTTKDKSGYTVGYGSAYNWWSTTRGYKKGQKPKLGAIACWKGGSSGYGHVAIVEKISEDGKTIWTSESAWQYWLYDCRPRTARKGTSNPWAAYARDGYTFQGFIYNPNASSGSYTDESDDGNDNDTGFSFEDMKKRAEKLYSSDNYEYIVSDSEENTSSSNTLTNTFKTALSGPEYSSFEIPHTKDSTKSFLTELNVDIKDVLKPAPKEQRKGKLITYDNVVAAPVIVLTLNDVTIGGYGNFGDVYPNYITSMSVKKINGKINQYTINLEYIVRFGEDPNFIDKLLSRTGFTNKIKLLYGDANGSTLFKDDEAIITDVSFNESVSSKTLSYTITAVSSIVSAISYTSNYSAKTSKPSTLINELFYSNSPQSKALLEALPGMSSRTLVNSSGLIPTTDAIVTTQTRINVSPLSQLLYYVDGMYNPETNSTYQLSFMDDTNNEFGGAYIKISEVNTTSTETLYGNYFELDVGYPNDTLVTNFTLNNDIYFPLVYKYNDKFSVWDYNIDNQGNISRVSANPLILNNSFNSRNVAQSVWWNKVTEYPVSAQITVRGLMKPIMLTSYIKLNVLFYGSKDIASGLYVVTGQTDSISGNGYFTTLDLLRVGQQ